ITQAQYEMLKRLIVAPVRAFAAALGVNVGKGTPGGKVWYSLLKQVAPAWDASGEARIDPEVPIEVKAPEHEAERVRSELHAKVRSEVIEELRREAERERPALPPPSGTDAEVEEMAAPVTKVVAVEPEEVDGESAEPDRWDDLPPA